MLVGGVAVEAASTRWCADRVERKASISVQPEGNSKVVPGQAMNPIHRPVTVEVTTVVALSQTSRQAYWQLHLSIISNDTHATKTERVEEAASKGASYDGGRGGEDATTILVEIELQTLARMYTQGWSFGHNMTVANQTDEFNVTTRKCWDTRAFWP